MIFREFLEPSFNAYHQFYEYMRHFKGKAIFILNIGEYSIKNIKKFMLIRNRGSTYELENASLNEFTGYNRTELTSLFNIFSKKVGTSIRFTKEILGELTDLYEGDARKIMNELYFRDKTRTVRV